MKVSVIIANYNGGNKAVKCVKLCLNYCDELIFIDDCSDDGSLEKIRKIKNYKLKIFRNIKNSGASFSRNYGAKMAKYNKLLFIDNDCYLKKKEFSKLLKYREDIVYPKIIDSNGEIYNHNPEHYLQNSVCFFIKKKVFNEIGGFDEKIRIYMEDVDFFYRCYIKRKSLKYVESSEGFHDGGKTSPIISKNFIHNLENTIYFCLKHKRFGLKIERFPNLLTIFLNLYRCLLNKDRLYGAKITNNRFKTLFLGTVAIINGGVYYFSTKNL